jgi:quinol monooxygenase YgiN
MIVIAGKIQVKPERREEARRAALEMVEATRREAGCISYAFYADLVDPGTFFIFEEWESDAALGAHFQSEHMARFQRQAAALVAAPPSINRYTVESATKMM